MRLCLDGMFYSIKLCGLYNLTTERDAFILSLVNFTSLVSTLPRELKDKHILAIECLLSVALQHRNYIGTAWKPVLECVSKLEELHSMSQKSDQRYSQGGASGANPVTTSSSTGH